MRIVFKNSKIFFAAAKWSAKGKIIKVDSNEVSKVSLPTNAKVYSRNLVDASQLMYRKIINDSGAEITDSSSYYKNYIPVLGGCLLQSNYGFSRAYLYDKDFNLLGRPFISNDIGIPAEYNGVPVVWARVQMTGGVTEDQLLSDVIVTKDESTAPTSYEAYQSNAVGTIYSPYSWVWADDLSEIEITAK